MVRGLIMEKFYLHGHQQSNKIMHNYLVLHGTSGPVPLKLGDELLIQLHPLLVLYYHLVASTTEKSPPRCECLLQHQDLT